MLEVDASEVSRYPGVLESIRRGELHAVVVHNVYSPALLQEVVARLERHDPPFLKTSFPAAFRSWFYGQNLNLAHPSLEGYFQQAAIFHEQLQALFPPGLGITDYLAGLMSRLDNGRPFLAPTGPREGEQYMFTTIRCHSPGGFLPPHFDNEQALRPSYVHLRSIVDPHMLSFVLSLTTAEEGGALQMYNHSADPLGRSLMNDDRARGRINIDELESVSIRVPPGAMIIVDSGRYLHSVSPILGQQKRWTVCSFMALSREGDAMYCWG